MMVFRILPIEFLSLQSSVYLDSIKVCLLKAGKTRFALTRHILIFQVVLAISFFVSNPEYLQVYDVSTIWTETIYQINNSGLFSPTLISIFRSINMISSISMYILTGNPALLRVLILQPFTRTCS